MPNISAHNPYQPSPHSPAGCLRVLLPTYLILLFGFYLRIYRLDAQAFTGDEAFTVVNWTQASLTHLFTSIAIIDPQPPLALLSLYAWIPLVGTSEFAARMLSVLAGTLTLATSFAITRRLASQQAAILAILLCAIHPFLLWHSQDLRPYSLWIATSALTLLFFLSFTRKPKPGFPDGLTYTFLATAAMYTFYLESFVLIAQNLYMAYRTYHNRHFLKPWILSQLTILLLIAPWYFSPQLRTSQYQPTAAMPDIPQAIAVLMFGDAFQTTCQTSLFPGAGSCQYLPLGIIAISILSAWLYKSNKTAFLITTYTLVPIILLSALTLLTERGYFRPRYLASAALPITIGVALPLQSLISSNTRFQSAKRVLAAIGTALILIISSTSLANYYFNPALSKAPNWHALASTLQSQTAPSDLVLFNYPDPAFIHYIQVPAERLYLPTTPNPPQLQADYDIAALLTNHNYLWFVPVYEPTWDGQQTIAHALNTQAQLISNQWIEHTNLRQYAAWEVSPTQIETPLHLLLGDLATIIGYRSTPPRSHWRPDTTITLEVFWKPIHKSKKDLTVFSHLLGPIQPNGSSLWSQEDYPPQDGHTSTTTWEPGTLIRDTYNLALPNASTPTTYTITIGLYDPQTNERYPLDPNTPQAEPNGATLLTFTLQPIDE